MDNELKKLEEVCGELDYKYQEGEFMNEGEWKRAWELVKILTKKLRDFENSKQLTSFLPL
jgi:uncharacterized protein YjaG (DUF416 family)